MGKLDLETLNHIKLEFGYYSDYSTSCLGYKYLCGKIKELESEKITITDFDIEQAEILIEELNEHRT